MARKKKQRFWQKPSFWEKVEKWKPYVKAGISALRVATMLVSPNPINYAMIANELIKATTNSNPSGPPIEPLELVEFFADLVIHKLTEEEVAIAVELFLETPVYLNDWRPNRPNCSMARGGMVCEGIYIPTGFTLSGISNTEMFKGLSFEEKDEAIWKIINEEQAKFDEIDRLAEEKAAHEEADRIYFEEKEALEQANQKIEEYKDSHSHVPPGVPPGASGQDEDLKQTSEDIIMTACCSKDSIESQVLTHLLVDSCYMALNN